MHALLTGDTRNPKWKRGLRTLTLLIALPAMMFACAYVRNDTTHYVAVADELRAPQAWQFDHTDAIGNPILGSRVDRYFLVDADPDQLVAPTTEMLQAAGFTLEVDQAPSDWCDTRPLGATPTLVCPTKIYPPCSTNGPGGPMTCYLTATRGGDEIYVVIFDRGERVSYSASYSVGSPNLSVVRITVDARL